MSSRLLCQLQLLHILLIALAIGGDCKSAPKLATPQSAAPYTLLDPHASASQFFSLSLIHWNDFHARFDDINNQSAHCAGGQQQPEDACFGGYARVVTVVRRLRRQRKNAIFLNAGDNFQGTFWYSVGRWNVTAQFLNLLPADAIAIGNHEFSHRIAGLWPFFSALKSPVIACNVDASEEPQLAGLFGKSVVIERYARKIGIIGVTLSNMNVIASTGLLRFADAIASIRHESRRLRQQLGVQIIIVLSHCGIDTDYEIAHTADLDIDVVVGGHTHTLMYSGRPVPNGEQPRDSYPAVVHLPKSVTDPHGRAVLIVQASAFSRWVGDLQVLFDGRGRVAGWRGNPVFLDSTIERDPEVVAQLKPWREYVRQQGAQKLGITQSTMERRPCFFSECKLGNLLADASVEAFRQTHPDRNVSLCLLHAGASRNTLNAGVITLGDLYTSFPFENTMDYVQMPGAQLLAVLEHSVSRSRSETEFVGQFMLQLAGLRVVFDVGRPVGKRVVEVKLRCGHLAGAKEDYCPVQRDRMYGMIVPSFLMEGGDGYTQFAQFGREHEIGPRDIDILTEYIQANSPLAVKRTGRIQIVQ